MICAGSTIHTKNKGHVSIDSLVRFVTVYTHRDRLKRVKERTESEYSGPVITLKHIGGQTKLTADHMVGVPHPEAHRAWRKNGLPEVHWTRADRLNQGEKVWIFNGSEFSLALLTNIDTSHFTGEVYGADVETDKTLITGGFVVKA
jgi:hypothetical protein